MEFTLTNYIEIGEEVIDEIVLRVLKEEEEFDEIYEDVVFKLVDLEISIQEYNQLYPLIEEEVIKRVNFRKNRDRLNKTRKILQI